MKLPFTKLEGLGNDFILWDGLSPTAPAQLKQGWEPSVEFLQKICDRRFGVGCDQILWLKPAPTSPGKSEQSLPQIEQQNLLQSAKPGIAKSISAKSMSANPITMDILNADGTRAEMCGNGLRAAVLYLWAHGPEPKKTHYPVWTLAGLLSGEVVLNESDQRGTMLSDPQIRVDMGPVQKLALEQTLDLSGNMDRVLSESGAFNSESLSKVAAQMGRAPKFVEVSMGNPHAVFFKDDLPTPYNTMRLEDLPLDVWGPIIEHHPRFLNRTNIEIVEVVDAVASPRTPHPAPSQRFGVDGGSAPASPRTPHPAPSQRFGVDGGSAPASPRPAEVTSHIHRTASAAEIRAGGATATVFGADSTAAAHIRVRVWERGAGLTLACGTGACASAVAAIATKRFAAPQLSTGNSAFAATPVRVSLPGGDLHVSWPGTLDAPVIKQGPARIVFLGTIDTE